MKILQSPQRTGSFSGIFEDDMPSKKKKRKKNLRNLRKEILF